MRSLTVHTAGLAVIFRQDAAHFHAHVAQLQSPCRLHPVCSLTVHTAGLAVITGHDAACITAHLTLPVLGVTLRCNPSKRCVIRTDSLSKAALL